jgi:hypothetical protein
MKVEEIVKLVMSKGIKDVIPKITCINDNIVHFEYQSMSNLYELSIITDSDIHCEMTFKELLEEVDIKYISFNIYATTQERLFTVDNKGHLIESVSKGC